MEPMEINIPEDIIYTNSTKKNKEKLWSQNQIGEKLEIFI